MASLELLRLKLRQWDVDIYDTYDYGTRRGTKPTDPSVCEKIYQFLDDRLNKRNGERQKAPYTAITKNLALSRVTLSYPQEVQGKTVYNYLEYIGVYKLHPLCWPCPVGRFSADLSDLSSETNSGSLVERMRCISEGAYEHCVFPAPFPTAGIFHSIREFGFAIFKGYVPRPMAEAGRDETFSFMKWVIRQFDMPHGVDIENNDFKALLDIPGRWWQSNRYTALKDCAWGTCRNTGYMKKFGTGKVFEFAEFTGSTPIAGVQEYLRNLVAAWHDVPTWELVRKPAGASLKPPGAPALPSHRDENRKGSLQIVVSCSVTQFCFWPRTHQYKGNLPRNKEGCVTPGGEQILKDSGYTSETYCADVGDVLLFVGGDLIHGGPAVANSSTEARVCLYPEFWPPNSDDAQKERKRRTRSGSGCCFCDHGKRGRYADADADTVGESKSEMS